MKQLTEAWSSDINQVITSRDAKFLKTSLALTAEIFHNLDAKIEEMRK